ncbi:uncharacterized protein LOC136032603 [Artemia franciscana]|uniref:uncharacterized protein LOC136032603 n=1 Tax=Artemia franciscana TaxID=6661 RepID=UPI0032DB0FCD
MGSLASLLQTMVHISTPLYFKTLPTGRSIEHRTSSPYHAQSNGLAEKAVGIAKNMIKKTQFCRSEMSNALLEYRNTPVDGMASPAQLLMSRNLQSTIPCTLEHLTPKIVPKSEFVESHLECQLRQQKYYNRHSKDLQELKQGQSVEAQIQGKSWEPAVMLHKHKLPRSYIVQTQDMKAYHQNRKYLRMSPDDTDLEQYQHTNSNGVLQLSSTSSPSAYSTPSKSPPQLSLFKPQGQAQKSVAKFRTKYRHPP